MKVKSGTDLPMSFRSLEHEALMSILWTALMIRKESKNFFGKNNVSSDAQFNILMTLKYSDGPLKQNELGNKLFVDKSNVTGLIDRMERDGLIARRNVEGDRRSFHVVRTAKGRRITDAIEKKYRDKISEIMGNTGDGDQRSIVRLMRLVRDGLQGERC